MQIDKTLFSEFSEIDRQNILGQCVKRTVRKKAVVINQGVSGRDMFFVVSGHQRVSVLSDDGKEISFGVLGKNDYFGELSLLDGRRQTATVTAIDDCVLLLLGYPRYKHLLQVHPHSATQLLTHLLVTMAERLRATDGLYQDSVFLDVAARLAKFLLRLSTPTGDSESGKRLLDIELSQYELGTLVNASRESVNKQLRDWESQGIIDMNKGKTIILEPDFLRHKADG